MRRADGSAGDVDYGRIGVGYSQYRQPDPEIAAAVRGALGDARRVVNVGAGSGSYEPTDREVVAVEPSAAMRSQRPAHLSPAVDAVAESLPFADDEFDAAMSTFSVHQWKALTAGLGEMRRVARGPVVVLTGDPGRLRQYWLTEYLPEAIEVEESRYPDPDLIARTLGGRSRIENVPIPLTCADRFSEAYYGRPELLLDPDARQAMSAWSFVERPAVERFDRELRRDLASGAWDARHGHLRTQPHFVGSLVLIIAEPD